MIHIKDVISASRNSTRKVPYKPVVVTIIIFIVIGIKSSILRNKCIFVIRSIGIAYRGSNICNGDTFFL